MQLTFQQDTLPPDLQTFAKTLLQWLETNTTTNDPQDPTPLIQQLEQWQEWLATEHPDFHLLWCFTPHLCVRLGPSERIYPITEWLQSRLEDVTIAQLSQEPLAWGALSSDTLLSVRREGWRIDVRHKVYRDQLDTEATSQPKHPRDRHGLWALFDDPEDILLWRQELNLAHEWGHMFAEAHIPYQEPLIEALTPHHPSQGATIFAWFEALLEGLAECVSQQGALSLLADLARIENQRPFAIALLWERAAEFAQPTKSLPLAHIRAHLLSLILPLTTLPSISIDADSTQINRHLASIHPLKTMTYQEFSARFAETKAWQTLQLALDQTGDLLQTILIQTIDLIPPPGHADSFIPTMLLQIKTLQEIINN